MSRRPGHLAARVNYGSLLLAANRNEEAESHFRRAVALAPRAPSALAGLGAALLRLGRKDDARSYLARAVALDPAHAEALNGLVLIGWSASYAYLAMERFWREARPSADH